MAEPRYQLSIVSGYRQPTGGSHTRRGMLEPAEISILDSAQCHKQVKVWATGRPIKGQLGGVGVERTIEIAAAECLALNQEERAWERQVLDFYEHGHSAYNNRFCRCHICRAGKAAYMRGYRERQQ